MTREPTDDEAYAWHRAALARLAPVIINEEPHCGWYKRKLVAKAVFVPARIWLDVPEHAIDAAGELVDQPVMRCEVNGQPRDPFEQWQWLADKPISEAEFKYLTARNNWAGWYAPHLPEANPRKPVDWLNSPTVL